MDNDCTQAATPLYTGQSSIVERVSMLEKKHAAEIHELHEANEHLRRRVRHLERELGTDFDSLPKATDAPRPMNGSVGGSLPSVSRY